VSEASNLVVALREIHGDDAWHGPGFRKTLTGVNASKAFARPIADYRSIWELVLHVAKWEEVFCLRLEGQSIIEPAEGDWPPVTDQSESAWQDSLKYADEAHDRLIQIVSNLKQADLERKVTGKDYTVAYMLHGIIRHHVYHIGQIALLKRLPKL